MKKYPELKNLVKIAKIFDALKVPYYITGGFAVSIYGRPRFTADIDMVIQISSLQADNFTIRLQKIFPKGYVDKKQINDALAQRGEFNIIDLESGLKVDFFIAKDSEFEKECFKNSQPQDLDYKVIFISPENLIISKLIWYQKSQSNRQLEDIISVIDIQKKLDIHYLKGWIKKLKLEKEWGMVKPNQDEKN